MAAAAIRAFLHHYVSDDEKCGASNRENLEISKSTLKWVRRYTVITGLIFVGGIYGLYLTRAQFSISERPYIWLAETNGDAIRVVSGEIAKWDISITNYGKSPATALLHRAQVFFGQDMDSKIPKDFFSKEIHAVNDQTVGVVIAPGEKRFTTAISESVLTDADVEFIKDTDAGIVVIGYYEYFDLNGTEYRSEICKFRFKTGAISDCKKHNKVS